MGSLLKRALVMAPAASASDSPNEIVPLFRVLPRRRRRASNRAEDRRHRRLDNGCCPSRRCCRCSGVVVVLCPRHLLREHRHSAATDALVVGACPAGPQATERGHVYLLGSQSRTGCCKPAASWMLYMAEPWAARSAAAERERAQHDVVHDFQAFVCVSVRRARPQ